MKLRLFTYCSFSRCKGRPPSCSQRSRLGQRSASFSSVKLWTLSTGTPFGLYISKDTCLFVKTTIHQIAPYLLFLVLKYWCLQLAGSGKYFTQMVCFRHLRVTHSESHTLFALVEFSSKCSKKCPSYVDKLHQCRETRSGWQPILHW